MPKGTHTFATSTTPTWDGRDEAGALVAAGTYFARLAWNGIVNATERVTIVR